MQAPTPDESPRDSGSEAKELPAPPSARRESTQAPHDSDNQAKAEDYEVVEAEDNHDHRDEPTNKKPSQMKRSLPRLTAESRAPSSNLGTDVEEPPTSSSIQATRADGSQQEPSVSPDGTIDTGPVHLQGSHEFGIPIRSESRSRSQAQDDSADDSDSSTDTEDSQQDNQTPRQSTSSASVKDKTEEDGENPTIQIPRVTPISSGLTFPPNLAELAEGLEDKYVDEFGNVLDWDGQVLGRVEGDLPSMIGRPVSATGEVFNEDDEVVGYVAENEKVNPPPPPPQPIEGMGDGLRVDHLGNILDANNNVIGHFNPEHTGKAVQERSGGQQSNSGGSSQGAQQQHQQKKEGQQEQCNCHPRNPKPTAAPSPSEIYLDVKSTNDGVQLIIKIPTVFNNGGPGPNIHIGTS